MPKGDPAGYLPNVIKARRGKRAANGGAAAPYKSRRNRASAYTQMGPSNSRQIFKPVKGFGQAAYNGRKKG